MELVHLKQASRLSIRRRLKTLLHSFFVIDEIDRQLWLIRRRRPNDLREIAFSIRYGLIENLPPADFFQLGLILRRSLLGLQSKGVLKLKKLLLSCLLSGLLILGHQILLNIRGENPPGGS
jgi:hypothetical protein